MSTAEEDFSTPAASDAGGSERPASVASGRTASFDPLGMVRPFVANFFNTNLLFANLLNDLADCMCVRVCLDQVKMNFYMSPLAMFAP